MKKSRKALFVFGFAALVLTACQDQKPQPVSPPPAAADPADVPSAITIEDQPSQQQIVWSSGREGTSVTELYRANPNGSGLTRLTHNRTADAEASWSFDHSSIVYMCDGTITQICKAKPDGSGVEVLFSAAGRDDIRNLRSPKLSPNGKVVVFAADAVDGIGGFRLLTPEIFAYNVDTKTLEKVTDDDKLVESAPELDAPGSQLGLFWLARESGENTDKASNRLVWLPPGATEYVFLTNTNEHVASFDVSRDGNWVVYEGGASRTAPTDVIVMGIDGSGKRTLTQTPFDDKRPSFSPDGTKIVYERFDQPTDKDTELYTIGRDGTGLQRITFNDVDDSDADWGVPPVTVSIGDAGVVEGNSGTTTLSFPVTLSVPAPASMSVDFATRTISAKTGSDYAATSGTLNFAAGEREKTVTVDVVGDTVPEPSESLEVLLSNPGAGLTLGQRSGRGLIRNDDVPPSPTPSPSASPSPGPSQSPTGAGQIAFTSGTGADFDIWIMSETGTGKRNLTNDPSVEGSPDISPDGSTVLFQRGSSGPPDIFQVPAAGGTAARVNGTSGDADVTPDWSPDGGAMAWAVNGPSGVDLVTARPPSGSPTKITSTSEMEAFPEWGRLSNGTEAIAFHVQPDDPEDPAGVWQVKMVELPGGAVRDFGQGRHPEISPDGTKLLFASNRGGGDYEIYVLNLAQAGASAVALTNNSVDDFTPTWSPDGTKIAWTSHPGNQSDVFTMDANGSNQRNVSNSPSTEDFEPSWGPAPASSAPASAPASAAMAGFLVALSAAGGLVSRARSRRVGRRATA